MIDLSLSEEQTLLQKTARDFAEKEIRPIVQQIEQRDPEKQKPWDFVRPVFKKAASLGLTTLLIPEKYGGGGGTCMDNMILQEELAAVDLGIAASYFAVTITSPKILMAGANEALLEKWLGEICSTDDFVLASAGSEPDTAGSDSFCFFPDPKIGLKSFAKREGDDYVINGSKAAFCTNAGAAKAFFVMARTDLSKPGFMSTSIFYVPADTPGLSIGKKTELMGWKTAQHAEVYLDDVRIPKENMLGDEASASLFFINALPYISSGLAACYVGLARRAYEYAVDYAKQRISWGQPIIKHQAVALKLADMLVDTQAARLMVWDAAYATDSKSPLALMKSTAAKTFAVDVAIKNSENAMKILGGYGVANEYETPKFLGDAWVGYACDGPKDMLRLNMVNFLPEFQV